MTSPGLPTARADWRRMGRTTRLVLGHPRWFAAAVLAALAAVSAFALPTKLGYFGAVVVGGTLSPLERLDALVALYPLVGGEGDPLRGALLYVVSAAVGVNLALVGYHLFEHEVGLRDGSGGAAGVLLAGLGAGCPTCGGALVAGGLSLAGVTGAVAALPLHGAEFLLAGTGAAVLGTHWTVEGMRGGEVRGCPVELEK